MGEIADDMVDGNCCALCGVYFIRSNGCPAVCDDCFEEGCGYEESTWNKI